MEKRIRWSPCGIVCPPPMGSEDPKRPPSGGPPVPYQPPFPQNRAGTSPTFIHQWLRGRAHERPLCFMWKRGGVHNPMVWVGAYPTHDRPTPCHPHQGVFCIEATPPWGSYCGYHLHETCKDAPSSLCFRGIPCLDEREGHGFHWKMGRFLLRSSLLHHSVGQRTTRYQMVEFFRMMKHPLGRKPDTSRCDHSDRPDAGFCRSFFAGHMSGDFLSSRVS